jgi:hypothetical protein
LLPRADLSLQDEVQFARLSSHAHAPLESQGSAWPTADRGRLSIIAKAYGFGLVDWRDGWFHCRIAHGRTADVFCDQVRAAGISASRALPLCLLQSIL